jgi:hypothetical protein
MTFIEKTAEVVQALEAEVEVLKRERETLLRGLMAAIEMAEDNGFDSAPTTEHLRRLIARAGWDEEDDDYD